MPTIYQAATTNNEAARNPFFIFGSDYPATQPFFHENAAPKTYILTARLVVFDCNQGGVPIPPFSPRILEQRLIVHNDVQATGQIFSLSVVYEHGSFFDRGDFQVLYYDRPGASAKQDLTVKVIQKDERKGAMDAIKYLAWHVWLSVDETLAIPR